MLALEVALLSNRGGRNYNEDACGHWHSDRHLCCVLADGAGGHGGGDIASKIAVQELIGRFSRGPSGDGTALAGLVRQTNEALINQREPGTAKQDMHSTAVCLVIDFVDHRAHWAHAGDSRMYWLRNGRVHARTRDHSLVQALVDAGVMTEQQMQGHPKRSELRSALGIPPEQLEVTGTNGNDAVQAGDVFLLCTDGLWEYVADEVLEQSLAAAPTPREWLDALSSAVVAAAGHKASHDNYTALVVWTRPV
jgi:PPM family protein phosphatase